MTASDAVIRSSALPDKTVADQLAAALGADRDFDRALGLFVATRSLRLMVRSFDSARPDEHEPFPEELAHGILSAAVEYEVALKRQFGIGRGRTVADHRAAAERVAAARRVMRYRTAQGLMHLGLWQFCDPDIGEVRGWLPGDYPPRAEDRVVPPAAPAVGGEV